MSTEESLQKNPPTHRKTPFWPTHPVLPRRQRIPPLEVITLMQKRCKTLDGWKRKKVRENKLDQRQNFYWLLQPLSVNKRQRGEEEDKDEGGRRCRSSSKVNDEVVTSSETSSEKDLSPPGSSPRQYNTMTLSRIDVSSHFSRNDDGRIRGGSATRFIRDLLRHRLTCVRLSNGDTTQERVNRQRANYRLKFSERQKCYSKGSSKSCSSDQQRKDVYDSDYVETTTTKGSSDSNSGIEHAREWLSLVRTEPVTSDASTSVSKASPFAKQTYHCLQISSLKGRSEVFQLARKEKMKCLDADEFFRWETLKKVGVYGIAGDLKYTIRQEIARQFSRSRADIDRNTQRKPAQKKQTKY